MFNKINENVMFDENGMEFRLAKGFPAKVWCSRDGKHIVRENETGGFRELKQFKNWNGYCRIALYYDNSKRNLLVHRLVALAFGIIDEYYEKVDIDHLSNVRDDNRVENLQALAHAENVAKSLNKPVAFIKGDEILYFRSVKSAAEYFVEKGISKTTLHHTEKNISASSKPYGYEKYYTNAEKFYSNVKYLKMENSND